MLTLDADLSGGRYSFKRSRHVLELLSVDYALLMPSEVVIILYDLRHASDEAGEPRRPLVLFDMLNGLEGWAANGSTLGC